MDESITIWLMIDHDNKPIILKKKMIGHWATFWDMKVFNVDVKIAPLDFHKNYTAKMSGSDITK